MKLRITSTGFKFDGTPEELVAMSQSEIPYTAINAYTRPRLEQQQAYLQPKLKGIPSSLSDFRLDHGVIPEVPVIEDKLAKASEVVRLKGKEAQIEDHAAVEPTQIQTDTKLQFEPVKTWAQKWEIIQKVFEVVGWMAVLLVAGFLMVSAYEQGFFNSVKPKPSPSSSPSPSPSPSSSPSPSPSAIPSSNDIRIIPVPPPPPPVGG
jgi:hypothetical protein